MSTISFQAVTKTFRHQRHRMLLRERLLEAARPAKGARFAALDQVSFEMAKGRAWG